MSDTLKTKPWWARARAKEVRYEAWHWCTTHPDVDCDLPAEPQPQHATRTRCQWWPDAGDRRITYGRSRGERFESRGFRRANRRGGRGSIAEGVGDFFEDLVDDLL